MARCWTWEPVELGEPLKPVGLVPQCLVAAPNTAAVYGRVRPQVQRMQVAVGPIKVDELLLHHFGAY